MQICDLAVFSHRDALPAREVVGGGEALRPADRHFDGPDVDGQPGRVLARDAIAVPSLRSGQAAIVDEARHLAGIWLAVATPPLWPLLAVNHLAPSRT